MFGYRQFAPDWGAGFGAVGKGGVSSLFGGGPAGLQGIATNNKRNADAQKAQQQDAAAQNAWKNPQLVDDAARAMAGGQPPAPTAPDGGIGPAPGGAPVPGSPGGYRSSNWVPSEDMSNPANQLKSATDQATRAAGGGQPRDDAMNGVGQGFNTPPPQPQRPQASQMYHGPNRYLSPTRYRGM